jgi:hypothetical protein
LKQVESKHHEFHEFQSTRRFLVGEVGFFEVARDDGSPWIDVEYESS